MKGGERDRVWAGGRGAERERTRSAVAADSSWRPDLMCSEVANDTSMVLNHPSMCLSVILGSSSGKKSE
jgi:hypothetical protein